MTSGGVRIDAKERSQLSAALEEVRTILSTHLDISQSDVERVSFDHGHTPVEVRVTPLGIETSDGRRLMGTLEARTDLTALTAEMQVRGWAFPTWPVIVAANTHTLVSAAVWPPAQLHRVELVSRIGLYKDDDVSRLWGPQLAALAALTQFDTFSFSYADLCEAPFGSCRTSDVFHIKEVSDGWPDDQFAAAAHQLRKWDYRAAGSQNGLSVVFPWSGPTDGVEAGEREAMAPSAVYTAEVIPHPLVGPGILTRLELPIAYNLEYGAQIANELNTYQAEVADGPALVGAWAVHTTTGRVTFAAFFPYRFYHFDLLVFPVIWAGVRTRFAEAWLLSRRELH